MAKECGNPYKTARKAAGLTQERAAMLLNVSVDSLRDYEGNIRPVPNDVAAAMCDAYDAQYLAITHLRMTSIGRQAIPAFQLRDLPEAVLNLLNAVQQFVDKNPTMICIAADGVISPSEQREWDNIILLADNLQTALMSVKFAVEGRRWMNIWRMLDLRSALGRPQEGRLTALYMSERQGTLEAHELRPGDDSGGFARDALCVR